ncbi:hypothetical protein [Luteibacter yeojuensis]|uniref:Uncharacterized protein n=1 Tax=Luteibacter yeojuensis TaxID=345309 RepID=A0A7X5TPB1_9GAMM|nr:hypothetical protein [Luteibacter yeojuensis]NID14613.1 hypothetical protein [Luteibacter yeojuensis]
MSLVSPLDDKPPSWAFAQPACVRTYYRLELAGPAGETATALLTAYVSERVVDFEGLVWCRGRVLFDLSGSFPVGAAPAQHGLESAVLQRLHAFMARPTAFGKPAAVLSLP